MAINHDTFLSEDSLQSLYSRLQHGILIDTNLFAIISKKDLETDPVQIQSQINIYKKKCKSLEKELEKLKKDH